MNTETGALKMGVDVGYTNTDAVVVDSAGRLTHKAKVPTGHSAPEGIAAAMGALVDAGAPMEAVRHVMVGSAFAVDAVNQRRDLRRVAVLRIGAPSTTGYPPFSGWPLDAAACIDAGYAIVRGGFRIDGEPSAPLDVEAVKRFCSEVAVRAETIAISCTFASARDDQEIQAREIIQNELDGAPVFVSSEMGSFGLINRENVTILSAALLTASEKLVSALWDLLARHGLQAIPWICQNDGTLMALDHALRFPVLTIGGGPANAMRGAARLSGVHDALVADVGGSKTDIGLLLAGHPAQSVSERAIGGVRTSLRMPIVTSVPVGGASTALDGGELPATAQRLIAEGVDQTKNSGGDQPLLVVGGAATLLGEGIAGVSEIVRPEHADVAGAFGAAVAEASGYVDRLVRLDEGNREAVLAELRDRALAEATRAGAHPKHTEITDVEEIPLAYLTNGSSRVWVKAAGPIQGF